jgi:hypothetical protein
MELAGLPTEERIAAQRAISVSLLEAADTAVVDVLISTAGDA